jgi:hypothetical protein
MSKGTRKGTYVYPRCPAQIAVSGLAVPGTQIGGCGF